MKANHGTFTMLADLAANIPLYCSLKWDLSVVLGTPWQGRAHTVPGFLGIITQVANKVEDVDLNVFEAGCGTSKQTVDILAKGSSLFSIWWQEHGLILKEMEIMG